MSKGQHRLKFMGYCMALMPPKDVDMDYSDLVEYARFQLCLKSNRLMKDPIWKDYTDEEVMVEYYAHIFTTDENARSEFDKEKMQNDDSIDDWLIEQTKSEGEVFEEKISFRPDSEN